MRQMRRLGKFPLRPYFAHQIQQHQPDDNPTEYENHFAPSCLPS